MGSLSWLLPMCVGSLDGVAWNVWRRERSKVCASFGFTMGIHVLPLCLFAFLDAMWYKLIVMHNMGHASICSISTLLVLCHLTRLSLGMGLHCFALKHTVRSIWRHSCWCIWHFHERICVPWFVCVKWNIYHIANVSMVDACTLYEVCERDVIWKI